MSSKSKRKSISKSQKDRMIEFIAERLEDSFKYNILKRDHEHLLVAERLELVEMPDIFYVIAINNPRMNAKELRELHRKNEREGRIVSHIIYKDGQCFMRRLFDDGYHRESLKDYSIKDRNSIIKSRKLERIVQETTTNLDNISVYYQQKTSRLNESLRGFEMSPVRQDYSHILEEDKYPGFSQRETSILWRLPKERFAIESAPALLLSDKNSRYGGIRPDPEEIKRRQQRSVQNSLF